MIQNSHPVPRLDLAPKLSRPLSLWNPLDYLRLLYWVFFFPQAVQWYIDTFGGNGFKKAKTLKDKWEWHRTNPIQRQLILQALTLIIVLLILGNRFLEQVGFTVDWGYVTRFVVISVVISVFMGLGMNGQGVVFSVMMSVTMSVMVGLGEIRWHSGASNVNAAAKIVVIIVVMGVAMSVGAGITMGVEARGGGALKFVAGGVGLGVFVVVFMFVVTFVVTFVMGGGVRGAVFVAHWTLGVAVVVVPLCGAFGVAFGVAIARLDNWLFTLPFSLLKPKYPLKKYPHLTPIPLPYLSSQVATWLRKDWEIGIQNINELLRFTLQCIPVVEAVNRVLAETPKEHLLYRIAQLTEELYDWQLVRFASASLNKALKLQTLAGLFFIVAFLPKRWQQPFNARFVAEMRLDTPARAGAAGFWYLHEQKPEKAIIH